MTGINPTGKLLDLLHDVKATSKTKDTNNDDKRDWRDVADSDYGNGDGNITMYEFTKMVHAIDLDHSIGDDIISNYFKKFDTETSEFIEKDGKETEVRNKYALTKAESDKAADAVSNYWDVSLMLDEVRNKISQDSEVQALVTKFPDQVAKCIDEFLAPYIDGACNGSITAETINVTEMVTAFKDTNGYKNLKLLEEADNVLREPDLLNDLKSTYSGQRNLDALLRANLESIIQEQLDSVVEGEFVSDGRLQVEALKSSYLKAVEDMIRDNSMNVKQNDNDTKINIYCFDTTDTNSEISKDESITLNGLDNLGYTAINSGDIVYANFDIGKENEDSHQYTYQITPSSGLTVTGNYVTNGECLISVKKNAATDQSIKVTVTNVFTGESVSRSYIIIVEDGKDTSVTNDNTPAEDGYSDNLLKDPKLGDYKFNLDLDIYGLLGDNAGISNYSFADIYNSNSVVELYTDECKHKKSTNHESEVEGALSNLADSIEGALAATGAFDADILKQAKYNVINEYNSKFSINGRNQNNDNIDYRHHGNYSAKELGKILGDEIRRDEKRGIASACDYKNKNRYSYGVSFKYLVDDIIEEYNKLAGTNIKL